MICDECRERPATVHMVTQINGHREERWLCEQCARSRQELQAFNFNLQSPAFAFQNLLSSLFDTERNGGSGFSQQRSRSPGRPDRCEVCGTTLADFRRTGLLGCAHCYARFAGPLEPVIRQVQGSTTHRGKRPLGQVAAGTGTGPMDAPGAGQRSGSMSGRPDVMPLPEAELATTDPNSLAAAVPARIARLREEMRKAVAEERYEDAARLRDRIRELEAMLVDNGDRGDREGQGEGAGNAGR